MTIIPYKRFGWQDTNLIIQGLCHRFPDAAHTGLGADEMVDMIQNLTGFVGRGRPDDDRILDMILWQWVAVRDSDSDERFDLAD